MAAGGRNTEKMPFSRAGSGALPRLLHHPCRSHERLKCRCHADIRRVNDQLEVGEV